MPSSAARTAVRLVMSPITISAPRSASGFALSRRPREHAYLRAVGQEATCQAGSEKAGPACDEDRHAWRSCRPGFRQAPVHAGISRHPARPLTDAARERATSAATFLTVGPCISMLV